MENLYGPQEARPLSRLNAIYQNRSRWRGLCARAWKFRRCSRIYPPSPPPPPFSSTTRFSPSCTWKWDLACASAYALLCWYINHKRRERTYACLYGGMYDVRLPRSCRCSYSKRESVGTSARAMSGNPNGHPINHASRHQIACARARVRLKAPLYRTRDAKRAVRRTQKLASDSRI